VEWSLSRGRKSSSRSATRGSCRSWRCGTRLAAGGRACDSSTMKRIGIVLLLMASCGGDDKGSTSLGAECAADSDCGDLACYCPGSIAPICVSSMCNDDADCQALYGADAYCAVEFENAGCDPVNTCLLS